MRLAWAAALLGVLAGCANPPPRPSRPPEEVRAQLVSLIPSRIEDRSGWASDIERAFSALELPASTENLCAVLAVIEQESTYVADPPVAGLGRIARQEIERRAARYKVPRLAVGAALKLRSPDGRSYEQRLAAVRTEQELSLLFEDLIGRVPLGQRLFGGANPVRTGGPMQVGIAFAQAHARQHGYPFGADASPGSIRREVFTRRGGLYFGIAHLLKYPNSCERHLYRFADFNAGWYASRNAAFQAALNRVAGTDLALDGDLVPQRRARDERGATERAALALAGELQLDERGILAALQRGDRFEFEQTPLYRGVFALADARAGQALPRAVMPRIVLHSPKFTRRLTTEWFATRVQGRYQRCVNRAFGR